MIFTLYKSKLLISTMEFDAIAHYPRLSEMDAKKLLEDKLETDIVFVNSIDPIKSRCAFFMSSADKAFIECEDISFLEKSMAKEVATTTATATATAKSDSFGNNVPMPTWLTQMVTELGAQSINIQYPCWQEILAAAPTKTWRINIVGLGDVGSTLTMGLRLMGDPIIDHIGIFDLDKNKVQRHIYECNQILSPFGGRYFPEVVEVSEDQIFDCDMFVFCVTAGVPPIGEEQTDVRIAQYKANSKIINNYAKKARNYGFNGIFAVVSDPVDQLCKSALVSSNIDENGVYDGKGLLPDRIRGYGLGVMNARAVFYSKQQNNTLHYESEGRAFGPHGEGLVIADSIENYNHDLSLYLTEKAKKANLVVRELGYKPYIAPALSSAALSILDTINGSWHYSSTFMGNAFIGAKNRLTPKGTEHELYILPMLLKQRLLETYERLSDFNE